MILWPRRLVVVESLGESDPKSLCPPRKVTKKQQSSPNQQKHELLPKPLEEPLINKPSKVVPLTDMAPMLRMLCEKLSRHNPLETYHFPTPNSVFGVERLITVLWADFEDIWKGDMIAETAMSLHQW